MDLQKHVTEKLQKVFTAAEDEIHFIDPRGDGHHWQLKIISPKFHGKSRLERSRMIYQILGDDLGKNIIHALQMKLLSDKELTQ